MLYAQSFGAGEIPLITAPRSSPTDFSGSVPVSALVPEIVPTFPTYAIPTTTPPAPTPGTLTSPTAGVCVTCQGTPQPSPALPGTAPAPVAPAPQPTVTATANSLVAELKKVPWWVWVVIGGLVLYKGSK